MPTPVESTQNIYPDEEGMLNKNGHAGNGSNQIIPIVVQPNCVKQNGTLVPQQALDIVLTVPTHPV